MVAEDRGSNVRHIVACSVLYWLGYALVESVLLVVLPRWFPVEGSVQASQPLAAALFVVVYAAIGAGVGLVASPLPSVVARMVILASLPLAYLANLGLHWYWDPLIYVPAFLASAAVALCVLSCWRGERGYEMPLATGVAVSGTLLLPVLAGESLGVQSTFIRAAAAVLLGLILVVWTMRRTGLTVPADGVVRRAVLSVLLVTVGGFGLAHVREATPVDGNEVSATEGQTAPPNIVLVSWDTVRADYLSLYGFPSPTTPRLDEIAGAATVFRRAYAPSNMTLSSHASLFTGLYPTAHGSHYRHPEFPNGMPLRQDVVTLAEALQAEGYVTYGVAANNAYVTRDFGLAQGFGSFDSRGPVVALAKVHKVYLRRLLRDLVVAAWPRLPLLPRATFDRLYRTADDITDEVLRLLDRAQSQQAPFFVFANLMDAHDPYLPPAPYDRLVEGKMDTFHSANFHAIAERILMDREPIEGDEYGHLHSQYAGGIATLDAALGRLVDALEQRGLYEDCVLLLVSDHGEVFGDGLLFGHAVSLEANQVHVPLVLKLPGQQTQRSVGSPVSLVDVMPTVLELAGVTVPDGLHGRSLLAPDPEREVFAEHFRPGHSLSWGEWFGGAQSAIFLADRKLVLHHDNGATELFRVGAEGQETGLSESSAQVPSDAEVLLERLELWRQALEVAKVGEEAVDPETLERLKALGYV